MIDLSAVVEVRQEGSAGRLMGPWPHAACWPQSFPVSAGPEFGLSGALTASTTASIYLLSLEHRPNTFRHVYCLFLNELP